MGGLDFKAIHESQHASEVRRPNKQIFAVVCIGFMIPNCINRI